MARRSRCPKRIPKKGSREDVYDGMACETKGGLRKNDLKKNKKGKIVSKKASRQSKRQYRENGLGSYQF